LASISVIIPNWNGAAHLPTCLDSLRKQTYQEWRIIVVDNGSEDGSSELLADRYPEVQVIALPQNRGFAGAVNVGIEASDDPMIALLNNDTEVDSGWLAALARAMEAYPQAGSIASKILLFDRRNTFHSAGDYYRTDGIPGNRGVWQEDREQYDRDEMIFGACAGAAAYRRSMLEDIGLFDESFFAFCEDVDLAWRAQLGGYKCLYAPQAVVYHRLSATGGGTTASYFTGRNTVWVIARNYPQSLLRRNWSKVLLAQARVSTDALGAWRGEAARARLRGQWDGLRSWSRLRRQSRFIREQRRVSDDYLASLLIN
jgi:GT2 family glycosyltransferase